MDTQPQEPTSELAKGTADRLREALLSLGFKEPKLPFAAQIEELRWLGSGTGSIFRDGGPWHEDLGRARNAFFVLMRFRPIAKMVELMSGTNGAKAALRRAYEIRLRDYASVAGQAGDRLFELELAAALSTTLHHQIQMGVNDIVIKQSDGPDCGVECKRPRSTGKIFDNVKKAIGQLLATSQLSECLGFVAVSVDELVENSWILGQRSTADAATIAQAKLQSILQDGDLRGRIADLLEAERVRAGEEFGPILGVLFIGLFGIEVDRPELGGSVLRQVMTCEVVTAHSAQTEEQFLRQSIVPMLHAGYGEAMR